MAIKDQLTLWPRVFYRHLSTGNSPLSEPTTPEVD